MPENDWNNNGAAIEAMLEAVGAVPAPMPATDVRPVEAEAPAYVSPLEARIAALEARVAQLEKDQP